MTEDRSYWNWINRHTAKQRRRRTQALPADDEADREEPTRPSEPIAIRTPPTSVLERLYSVLGKRR